MKKRTTIIIVTIMGLSFIALLLLQIRYINEMVTMKHEQFDELVNRSLYVACHRLELNATMHELEKNLGGGEQSAERQDGDTATTKPSLTLFQRQAMTMPPGTASKVLILRKEQPQTFNKMAKRQQQFRNRYLYEKALVDEAIINILYAASNESLESRLNTAMLEQNIRSELHSNGIDLLFHITVTNQDNRELYRCADYTKDGNEQSYSRVIFQNDPADNSGEVHIHFPSLNKYLFSSVSFMIPAVIFTGILILIFIFVNVALVRQKRYDEMKNDFISNMTHELKTPISSISLAAQMLGDGTLNKNEKMMQHLGGVINDETRRLRFLVDTVLQMSMFDRKDAVLKKKEIDINEIVENAAASFRLRVEHTKGGIQINIGAIDSRIIGDEIHITNVFNNIFDNAIKYRHTERPINLLVNTWNEDNKVCIGIEDNGIGIKKENLKKIFDKFYRVHTGNRHDIKGFGLGLSYVKNIVTLHQGEVNVESEYGQGTTFVIRLPIAVHNKETT